MIIKRGKLPTRKDLVGQRVLCKKSWWCPYVVGETYTITLSKDGLVVLEGQGNNGYDAEWEVILPKTIEELL